MKKEILQRVWSIIVIAGVAGVFYFIAIFFDVFVKVFFLTP
ncbi:MAG: hypothetical protein UX81_C0043G0007 [Parcubacteria group bacterium GW2011_GWA2_47_12]|nr:MAG: hypothetical protein UX81_C0043G0007 [Parcubacteria group bacterium GW2011_GWA2_47_12]